MHWYRPTSHAFQTEVGILSVNISVAGVGQIVVTAVNVTVAKETLATRSMCPLFAIVLV